MAYPLKKKKSALNKETIKEIEYLEKLFGSSIRAANGTSEGLDDLFNNQAEKIRRQINKLKESQ
jgi:hypothetical protein